MIHRRWRILLTVAVLALSGCAHKEDIARGGDRDSTALTVRLAFFPNVTHAAALVVTGSGAFAQALSPRIKIEEQVFTAGSAEIEALFADAVDIGYIGPGPALNGFLKSKGKTLRIISGASSGGVALVVQNDSDIRDLKGLSGKQVAVPQVGGTQDISLRHALQTVGLNSTDKGGTVSVVPTAPTDTLALFTKKELDAAWVPEPWVSRIVKEGNGRILIDERDLWPGRKFATAVVIARTRFLEEHPDLVQKFLGAHVQAIEEIKNHPDQARKIVGGRIRELTGKVIAQDLLRAALSRTDITYDPLRESVLTFADWSKMLGYQREGRGVLKGLIDVTLLNAVLVQRKQPPIP